MLWTAFLVFSAALHVESLVAMNHEFIDLDTMSLIWKLVNKDIVDESTESFTFLRRSCLVFQRWIPFFKECHTEDEATSTPMFVKSERGLVVFQDRKLSQNDDHVNETEWVFISIHIMVIKDDVFFTSVDTDFVSLDWCCYSCFMCGKINTKMTRNNYVIFTRMETTVNFVEHDKHVDSVGVADNLKACFNTTIFNSHFTYKRNVSSVYPYHNGCVDKCCIDLYTNERWHKDLDFPRYITLTWITRCHNAFMIHSVNMIFLQSVLIKKYSGVFQPWIISLSVYLDTFSTFQQLFQPKRTVLRKDILYYWKLTDVKFENSDGRTKFTNPHLNCLIRFMYPGFWNIPCWFQLRPNFSKPAKKLIFYDGFSTQHTCTTHKESHPRPKLPLKSRTSESIEQLSKLMDPIHVGNINVKTMKNETSPRNASIAGHENIKRHEKLSVNSLFNRVTYSSNVTSDTTTESFDQYLSVFMYGLFHTVLLFITKSQLLSASTLESTPLSKSSTNKEYDCVNDKYYGNKTFVELILYIVSIILYLEGVFANFAFIGYVINQRFPKITIQVDQRSTTTNRSQQYFDMVPHTTYEFRGKNVNSFIGITSNKYIMIEPNPDIKQHGILATNEQNIIESSRNLDIPCKFQSTFSTQGDTNIFKKEVIKGGVHRDPSITQHPQSTLVKRGYTGNDNEDHEDISPVLPSTEEESEETLLKLIGEIHEDTDMLENINSKSDLSINPRQNEQNRSENEFEITNSISQRNAMYIGHHKDMDNCMHGKMNNESDLRITPTQDTQNLTQNESVFTDSTALVSFIDAEENIHFHTCHPFALNNKDQSMASDYSTQRDSEEHRALESNLSSISSACSEEHLPSKLASSQNFEMFSAVRLTKKIAISRKRENDANKIFRLNKIKTSRSADEKCPLKICKLNENNICIAIQVRRFFKKQDRKTKRISRRILRRIHACSDFVKYHEPGRLICYPVYSGQVSSNQMQQEQVTQSNFAIQENDLFSFQRSEQFNSIGTLSSIFSSFSVESSTEDIRYHLEWMRLASFGRFDSREVHALRLARGGWYSTGQGDQTVCFSCQRVHQNWRRNDNPDGFHNANCSYVNQRSNNIPIPRDSSITRDSSRIEEIQNTGDTFYRDHSTDNTRLAHSQSENETTTNRSVQNLASSSDSVSSSIPLSSELRSSNSAGVPESTDQVTASQEETKRAQLDALKRDPMGINFDRPKYPSNAILSERIKSFSEWPASMTQTPRDMAFAGFFYAGYGDYTRCFFCGGGLRNWEAGDDPWVEHARWFSKCAFVRQNKGQGFIDQVLQRAAELEKIENSSREDRKPKDEKVMQSEAVLCIKRMGYTDEIIRSAIDTMKARLPRGKHKVSAHEILEVVLEMSSSQQTVNKERDLSTDVRSTDVTQTTGDDNSEMGASCLENVMENELTSLELENRNLKGQLVCAICEERNVSIAFLPCGHLTCCEDCAPAMRKCPICREFVRGTVKTFLV